MEYPAYEKYQPSRLEWLDVIPQNWDVTRLRLLSSRYSGGTPSKDKPEYWQEGTIPWLNSGAVNQGTITKPSTYITELGLKESSAKWIPEEAIIIALAGQGKTKGTAAYTTFKTTCNQSMGVVVFEKDFPRYMYWWLASQYKNIRGMASSDARDGLNLEMLGTIPCPLPSFSEQQKIAAFLDYKTQQIDQLIEKKKALIEKLEEKRIAVITQAVTKGLDKNAKLKPSGVDWLGDVPEHWLIRPLKYFVKFIDGDRSSEYPSGNEVLNEGVPFLSSKNIVNNQLDLTGLQFISQEKFDRLGRGKLERNDILVTVRGSVGNVALYNSPEYDTGFINAQMTIARSVDGYVPEFIYFVMNSIVWLEQISFLSYGTAQQQLSNNVLEKLIVAIPKDVKEQNEIIENINCSLKKIDDMKSANNLAVDRLEEYHSAIITSAVTGKIDVREVEVPKGIA